MLDLMRKHAQNWGMKVLLGIIIIVFVFYFGSMRDQDKAATIATFDGKAISYADFQREYQNIIDLYRSRYGQTFNDDLIKALNLKEQTVDNLIRQAIIMSKAEELGIRVSDEELKNSILAYPGFQREGAFDQRVYEETLRLNKMAPETFEARQRNALVASKLQDLILKGVLVSEGEVFDLYRLQNEKVSVSLLKFNSKDYRQQVNFTREALEGFLKKQGNELRVPEQVQVKYIAFPAADFFSTVKITEEDIKDFYDRNKGKLAKPGGAPPALSQVREILAAELKQVGGMARAQEAAKQAHDTIYQQENFDAFATGKGLKVHTSPLFSANSIPPEFRSLRDFSKNVFALQPKEISKVMSDDKGYYLFQIAAKKPSYTPSLKEAEKQIENLYVEKEASVLCQKEAETLLDRLKKGEKWAEIAREKKLKPVETGFFVPGENIPELGRSEQIMDALLQISEASPYPDKVLPSNDGFVILRFQARGKVDEAAFQTRKEELKKILGELKKNETLNSWIEGLKTSLIKEGRLKINKEAKDI